jgi:hypothetical protein
LGSFPSSFTTDASFCRQTPTLRAGSLPAAQHLLHEHGSDAGQGGLCKGAAQEASGAARFPASGGSAQEVAQQARLLMNLTGNIRKPVQISEALASMWGETGRVKPSTLRPTRQQLAELFPIFLGEASKRITGCLRIFRGRRPVGHFPITVQDFLVFIAFRGGPSSNRLRKSLNPSRV